MTAPIRILHLEDDPNDAELIAIELASQKQEWPYKIVQVPTQNKFSEALAKDHFDVILADNSGPFFSGQDALAMVREKHPHAVFLFVSGHLEGNPEIAAMKTGADGFVNKAHLHALVPAIQQALKTKKN